MQYLRAHLWLRYLVAILATTLLMIWISVNEDAQWRAATRQALFWATSVTFGWLQMILIARGVRATIAGRNWPGWALLMATALIGAMPLTFEIRWLLETIVAPANGLPPPWITYLNVTVINLVFCLVQYVMIERWPLGEAETIRSESASDLAPTRPRVSLLSRRPEGLAGEILYLKMEDHYLRVTTTDGSGMVLHRLSDACRDLASVDGMQVHKSWWVSHAAVQEIRHANRKRSILTSDGSEIPVGRSFEPKLRDNGWI